MNEPVITEQQIEDLFTKLDGLDLDPQQRDLLTAIVAVARDLTEVQIDDASVSFHEDFTGSFTPHKASLVIEYAHTPTLPGMISRNPGANPAMISRSMISRNPHP